MNKLNKRCLECNKLFKACLNCSKLGAFGWRSSFCSIECFKTQMSKRLEEDNMRKNKENKYGMKFPIRGVTHENNRMHDIHTFAINNSKDNIFISNENDLEFCVDDFVYFYIPGHVMKDIIEQIYKNGFEDGKKTKIKNNYKITNIE